MVADIEVDKVADMAILRWTRWLTWWPTWWWLTWTMEVDIVADIEVDKCGRHGGRIDIEIQFGERVG